LAIDKRKSEKILIIIHIQGIERKQMKYKENEKLTVF